MQIVTAYKKSNVGLTTKAESFSLFGINYRELVNELGLIRQYGYTTLKT